MQLTCVFATFDLINECQVNLDFRSGPAYYEYEVWLSSFPYG